MDEGCFDAGRAHWVYSYLNEEYFLEGTGWLATLTGGTTGLLSCRPEAMLVAGPATEVSVKYVVNVRLESQLLSFIGWLLYFATER